VTAGGDLSLTIKRCEAFAGAFWAGCVGTAEDTPDGAFGAGAAGSVAAFAPEGSEIAKIAARLINRKRVCFICLASFSEK
jgi:hypothetical protein